ncbi:MAG TPA: DUF1345 domain-containing protein, partial [Rubrobacter sp.]|nr:DUF1345 domain-containing protein [Rubrobacter sp.]
SITAMRRLPAGFDSPERGTDALDFDYYAFGVGTTFTSPEVEVTSRVVRRTTSAHGAFSFFYNTAILALVVNLLIAGAAKTRRKPSRRAFLFSPSIRRPPGSFQLPG